MLRCKSLALAAFLLFSPLSSAQRRSCHQVVITNFIHDIPRGQKRSVLEKDNPMLFQWINRAEENSLGILGLGEGDSDVILGILQRGLHRKPWKVIAYDVGYPRHTPEGSIHDLRDAHSQVVSNRYYYGPSQPLVETYPRNFLSGLFQHMDIKEEDGQRQRFHFIFSISSLSFVLNAVGADEQLFILMNLLDHMTTNGTIVIYPFVDIQESLSEILDELQRHGLIKSYSLVANGASVTFKNLVIVK